jgi:hypothetical protein
MKQNTIIFNDSELHAILINQTRYCLTRRSYAVSECADLLKSKWSQIPINTQTIIRRDIATAIEDDDRTILFHSTHISRNGYLISRVSKLRCGALTLRFDADRDSSGHADRTWACFLGIYAAGNQKRLILPQFSIDQR